MNKKVIAAKRALEEVLAVRKGERVLVITDVHTKEVGNAFMEAAKELETDVKIYFLPEEKRPLKEIPENLLNAISSIDIGITALKGGSEETPFRISLIRQIMKVARKLGHGPGITEAMMEEGPMNVNYKEMQSNATKLINSFKNVCSVKITSPNGSDFILNIEDRSFKTDVFIEDKAWGNLPSGEIWCGPVEDKGDGIIVCDGSIGDLGYVPSPVKIKIRNGKIENIDCEDKKFEGKIKELVSIDEEASQIGELGIGLNPGAKITGNLLEDEKAFKTCHVAFGNNLDMPGGRNKSKTHRDFLIRSPTIEATNKDNSKTLFLKDGIIII